MKTACISRYGAFGDILHTAHLPRLIKEFYKVDHITYETNHQGMVILENNPFIDELVEVFPLKFTWNRIYKHWDSLADSYDLFFNLFHSVEYGCIAMEDEQSYYRNDAYRREKYGKMPMCDVATKWAGLPESYYGTRGEMFYPQDEHDKAMAWMESCKSKYGVKYILLYTLSGSSLHKKIANAEEIGRKILAKYPDTMIVTTGDEHCKNQDFSGDRILSKVNSWNFRTAALMAKYTDIYLGPNTGLSCVANSWDTPAIQLFTADSLITHSSYAKNAYGIQSPIRCSPCHKGPYKFIGCPIKDNYPACIFHDHDMIMETLEKLRNECLPRTTQA